jgi:hypothetical protein
MNRCIPLTERQSDQVLLKRRLLPIGASMGENGRGENGRAVMPNPHRSFKAPVTDVPGAVAEIRAALEGPDAWPATLVASSKVTDSAHRQTIGGSR